MSIINFSHCSKFPTIFSRVAIHCYITSICACRNGHVIGKFLLYSVWIKYTSPFGNYIITVDINTICHFVAIIIFLHIIPSATRSILVFITLFSTFDSDCILRIIYFGHLGKFPTSHVTTNIASFCTSRNSYIVSQLGWFWFRFRKD